MAVDFGAAAQAYSQAFSRGEGMGDPSQLAQQGADAVAGQPSFAELVQEGMQNAIETQREAEATAQAGLAGEAGMTDVVLAMNSAETTLDAVTAVRDKLVQAYKDITKMPL